MRDSFDRSEKTALPIPPLLLSAAVGMVGLVAAGLLFTSGDQPRTELPGNTSDKSQVARPLAGKPASAGEALYPGELASAKERPSPKEPPSAKEPPLAKEPPSAEEPPSTKEPARTEEPGPPGGPPSKPSGAENGGRRPSGQPPSPRPPGPRTMADLVEQAERTEPPGTAPLEGGTVTGYLTAARRAMARRDLKAARQHADSAVRAARSPTERGEAQRVGTLLESLEIFWQSVREEAGRLQSGHEIRIGDYHVVVVESGENAIIIHVRGLNRRYTMENLPQIMAVGLAQRRLKKGDPSTNLHVGSFLAVDARGDRQQARRRWQDAGELGAALMPELEMAPPLTRTSRARGGPEPLPGGAKKLPVPEAAAQAKAEARVRRLFAGDFQKANTPKQKMALVERLAAAAGKSDNDPAARFAMYSLARDLAAAVGEPRSIFRVIDEMDRCYQIDAMDMKAEALLTAWQSKEAQKHRRAVVGQSLGLLDSAVRSRNYRAADRVVQVVIAAARGAKDYRAARQFEELAKTIKAALRGSG